MRHEDFRGFRAVFAVLVVFWVLVGLMVYSCAADASEAWKRVAVVDAVQITWHTVSRKDLRRVAVRYANDMTMTRRAGFAVLRRVSGEYVCDVYVLESASQAVREHEQRHCYGWGH